jgi:hypothetical protein
MSSNVYLFVISSLNHPVYRQVQMKRRHLLRHYNIPYTVLINHDESSLDDKKVPTLVPMQEDEIMYNGAGYNPYMAQKFLTAVKMLFRSYPHYDDIPNYIIRINATVYVHYPSLLKVLNDENFPKERVLAGPNWGNIFVQGMVMVFSKDVLMNMLQDPKIYSKQIMKNNDDVSLSMLADPYSKWIDWTDHVCAMRACPTDDKGLYYPEKIKPLENGKWIFRICEYDNNRKMDLVNWDVLLKYFQEYEIVSQRMTTTFEPLPIQADDVVVRNNRGYVWATVFLVVFFLLFMRFILDIEKNKTKLKLFYGRTKDAISKYFMVMKKTY